MMISMIGLVRLKLRLLLRGTAQLEIELLTLTLTQLVLQFLLMIMYQGKDSMLMILTSLVWILAPCIQT